MQKIGTEVREVELGLREGVNFQLTKGELVVGYVPRDSFFLTSSVLHIEATSSTQSLASKSGDEVVVVDRYCEAPPYARSETQTAMPYGPSNYMPLCK